MHRLIVFDDEFRLLYRNLLYYVIIKIKSFDIGPILAKRVVEISPNKFTSYKLLDYLSNIGNEMVIRF